jgi:hypothetical protein
MKWFNKNSPGLQPEGAKITTQTGIAAKERKDRKKTGIAAKRHKKRKEIKRIKSELSRYRLKTRIRVFADFSRFLPRSFFCDLCALSRLFPFRSLAPTFSHPPFFAPFVPFCGYSRLIFALMRLQPWAVLSDHFMVKPSHTPISRSKR